MKVAILNDSHFGLKNSADVFIDYTERFFRDIFFPHCVAHDIRHIIHLGDFYDHRKYVNFKILARVRAMFFEPMIAAGMEMTIIPGNHDVYFRNTNSLCGLQEVLGGYTDAVSVCTRPQVRSIGGVPIGFLPWVTGDNHGESIEFIEKCPASILMAHLELKGFEMMKGMPVAAHGMDADMFKRFEMVLSGHYHTKSTRGNIHYLGTQYEQTWSDADDPKFFHVLDLRSRELTHVRNPLTMFNRFVYNDSIYPSPGDVIGATDFTRAANSCVKVVVAKKTDPFIFDKYVTLLQAAGPFDLKIAESFEEFAGASISDELVSTEDTGKLLSTYIEAIETDLDRERLKTLIQELYAEAQSGDIV